MEKQAFRNMLEQLHQELSGTESLDESSKELLLSVQEDIEQLLDTDNAGAAHHDSLGGKLSNAIDEFEETHPDMVLTMKHVLDSLANMGL